MAEYRQYGELMFVLGIHTVNLTQCSPMIFLLFCLLKIMYVDQIFIINCCLN